MASILLLTSFIAFSNALSKFGPILLQGAPIEEPMSLTGNLTMPLRQAAEKAGIFIGSALNYYHLQQDSTYAKVGGEQYSLMTAENGCKWQATEPSYNQFDFTQCDYDYQYAKSKNMVFRGKPFLS